MFSINQEELQLLFLLLEIINYYFLRKVPAGVHSVDCSDVMPHVSTPGVHSAYASSTGDANAGQPIRNRGIYLERGDRVYVGVYAEGPNTAGSHMLLE